MAATTSLLSLAPLSSPPPLQRPFLSPPPCQSQISNPILLRPKLSSIYPLGSRALGSNDPTKEAAAFLDENGVVEDMDGYLNHLSLEYDSVWDTKPSWCQPWTIALTGLLGIAVSWLVLHSVPVTALVSSIICGWWYIFLYVYPKAYSNMIAERRKKVTDGVEDTFGLKKPP